MDEGPTTENPVLTGTVKWFSGRKGYGFIIGPSGEDVFVHYSAIEGEGFRRLQDGEVVDYLLVKRPNGWAAERVWKRSENSAQLPPK